MYIYMYIIILNGCESGAKFNLCCLRNKIVDYIDIKINNTSIEGVYDTKFLGVHVDSQLSWKKQIDYTCKKLSKCVAIISKARIKLYNPSLIMLYYSLAYQYFMYCNHEWGNDYSTSLEKTCISSKGACQNNKKNSPFRAHSEPLLYANRLLIVIDINEHVVRMFMYQWVNKNLPQIFKNFYQYRRNGHVHNTRNVDDPHVLNGRLNVRWFSLKVNGAKQWNYFPSYSKCSTSLPIFKQNIKIYLRERKMFTGWL